MTYYSKRYLKEKWDALKWDMDMLLANEDDRIDEEKVKKVRNEMNYYIDAIKKEINKENKPIVDAEPTVKAIPLDKPFCKMVYGDYVCYNRYWLMKHLPMELDILQGKAIPIEWLKNKAKDLADAYWNNVRNKLVLNMNELPLVIDEMIRIWEKENADNN